MKKPTKGHPDKSWDKGKSRYNLRKRDFRANIRTGIEYFKEAQAAADEEFTYHTYRAEPDHTYDIPLVIRGKGKSQKERKLERKI